MTRAWREKILLNLHLRRVSLVTLMMLMLRNDPATTSCCSWSFCSWLMMVVAGSFLNINIINVTRLTLRRWRFNNGGGGGGGGVSSG